jgi:LmbE family N-acetylglucosaminyl deacetylase
MSQTKKKVKILFFSPHADDLEFGASLPCMQALKLGNEVIEVLMTNCEYGTSCVEFKGNRLKRIRMRELEKAAKIYEKQARNELKIVKLGFIDGFLPLDEKSVNSVLKLIRDEKPRVIFAPDPWYAIDFHYDHLNTGRLVYFALKRLKKEELPQRIYFYYSFKTNLAIKYKYEDLKIAAEALAQHRSQITPLNIKTTLFFLKILLLTRYLKNRGFGKQVRKLRFINGKPELHGEFTLREKFNYFLFFKRMGVPAKHEYYPNPRELGLI